MRHHVASLIWVTFLTACGDDGSTPPPPDATISPACMEAVNHSDFAWLAENVFEKHCGNFSSCHRSMGPTGPEIPKADLDLMRESSYGELVNVPSFYFSDWVRVMPGSCEQSYILVRISDMFDGDAGVPNHGVVPGPLDGGTYMPPKSKPICVQKREAICRWIMNGALNDGYDAGPGGDADAGAPDASP